jgi:hypothetical protein
MHRLFTKTGGSTGSGVTENRLIPGRRTEVEPCLSVYRRTGWARPALAACCLLLAA